jgi:hypothetical protein
MRPKAPSKYLGGYPPALVEQVHRLIDQDQLADLLLQKYVGVSIRHGDFADLFAGKTRPRR